MNLASFYLVFFTALSSIFFKFCPNLTYIIALVISLSLKKSLNIVILGNPLLLQILFGIILLVLPSPLLKKTGDKVGNAIEGVGGEKARNVAYKILSDFAEGLKNSKHNGYINTNLQ